MIARFFIDRPIFATVLSVVITLIGGIALFSLPIAQYPRITPPGVVVSISYPGASAQVVADTVAAPIEQQVNGVPGMLYMSSQMGNDGTYSLTVTFDLGVDLKTALVMVQNRVTLAMPQLPTEVQNQGITIRKKTPDILMIINFFSPNGRYDDLYLSNFATINVRDELLRVDGVSDINYQGQRDYSIRAWLDPQKLASRSLTAIDVANAIRAQNLDAPAGQIGSPPAKNDQSFQFPIDTLGRLQDPNDFRNIIIKVAQSQAVKPSTGGTPSSSMPINLTGPTSTSDSTTGNSTITTINQSSSNSSDSSSGSSAPSSATTTNGSSLASSGTSSGSTAGGSTTAGASTGGGGNSSGGGTTGAGAVGGSTNGSSTSNGSDSSSTGMSIASGSSVNSVGSGVLAGQTLGRGPGRPSAALVRLGDVARVELGAQNYNQACTFDGKPSVGLSVYQLPGTNALEVADRVRAKMEDLKKRFPDGVEYEIGYDTTPFIRESVYDVVQTLIEAVALVGLVVLLFLQDWRAMILPMIDVPVSIIGTFAVMALLGFSLNNISLFGLVLAIGIVVDDAIVVLENIERLIATGLDVRSATIKAMDEVSGPIFAVALVLCAVFIPCAFISGITGQFFRQFAVTIAVSTLISALNAITMTPSRAVLLFRMEEGGKGHEFQREALPWWIFGVAGGIMTVWLGPKYLPQWTNPLVPESPGWSRWVNHAAWFTPGAFLGGCLGWIIIRPLNFALGWFFRLFNRGFDAMAAGYGWTIGRMLRVSTVFLVLYGGLLLLTWWVFQNAPNGFIPQQDQGRLIVNVQLPDSSSLQRTQEIVAKVEAIALKTPGVAHTVAFSGMSFLLQSTSPNFASLFVVLDPFETRQSRDKRDTAIMARLRKAWAAEIQDAMVTVYGASPVPGLGVAGGFKLVIEDRGDLGLDALQKQTDALVRKLRGIPGLNNVATQFRSSTPQLFLQIDRTKAASLGVALSDVNQTLDMYLGSLYVNSFNDFGRHWQVTIQAEGDFRNETRAINLFQVRNQQGQMVPLGTLVELREIGGPISVMRYNLYRSASINGNIQTGYSTGDAIAEIERQARETLPLSMKAEWTELMFMQIRAGNTSTYVFLLAIVCVFLALSALYESWALPLAVILVVPLCLLCSIVGVRYTDRDVNIFVQIGLVVLVGLACKNAILIVEYAKQLQHEGEGQSIIDATREASRLRLRPILMTSFAFILGVVPLMLAAGAGAEMRRSLGIAVFSGMLGVTLFGVFLTPVFFYVIQSSGAVSLKLSATLRWPLLIVVGGVLGLICGWLLASLGVVSLPVGLGVGAPAGSLAVLAANGIGQALHRSGK